MSTNILSQKVLHYMLSKVFHKILSLWILLTASTLMASSGSIISDWNETAHQVMLRIPTPPRSPLNDLAYVHIAIFDAVNAIDRKYKPFAVDVHCSFRGANKENAVAAAARKVLRTLYPADSLYIDSVYYTRVNLKSNPPNLAGIEIGEQVAEMYMASRQNDRSNLIIGYTWQDPGLGVYQTTPPGSPQYVPIGTNAAQMVPFAVNSASQFRAPAFPAYTSDTYTKDFNEVKKYGSLDSSFTTPEQREIARFHTENPGIHVPRNVRDIVRSKNLKLEDACRLYAQIYAGIADALITGYETKYFYNCWRPVTAIRQADIDGNPNTEMDPLWQPFVATPRHPEYPAAHGFVSGAITYTLEKFFGTSNVDVTLTSTVTKTQHHFTNTNDYRAEIVNARIYGGMHFRTSVEQGLEIGRKVAEWIAQNKFVKNSGNNGPGITTTLEQNDASVRNFELEQNFPNPFNPATLITYSIPLTELVNLTVYDILGREVAVLVNEQKTTGTYKVHFNASNLPTGIYIYRIKAGQFEQSKKLILMK